MSITKNVTVIYLCLRNSRNGKGVSGKFAEMFDFFYFVPFFPLHLGNEYEITNVEKLKKSKTSGWNYLYI
jgi:hypothetical protein